MTTRYTCALNGQPLDALDESIHITDIEEPAPVMRTVTAVAPLGGTRLLRHVRASLAVQVRFLICAYDPATRRRVLQNVRAWASEGGMLTVGDRPGQRLRVVCSAMPWISALSWLDELTLTFTAWETPYWETDAPISVTTSGSDVLSIPGDAGLCPVDCRIRNRGSAPLTNLTLTVGGTAMAFTGLSLSAGAEMTVSVLLERLAVEAGGHSLLMHRTPESHDLLLGRCGQENAVTVAADQAVQATFTARGRYL